jgi:protease IV
MRLLPLLAILLLTSGCGFPSFLITPVSNTTELKEITVEKSPKFFSSDKIAIVEVEGMLMNMRTGGLLQPQENKVSLFVQQLDTISKDSSVKAVVLRINSPGGTVTASDTMYQTLVNFKKKTHKPVIASTQDLCASGAYYVACGADTIVAHPTSVIGSIGVVFQTFNLEGTMNKIGAQSDAIKSGPFKDMGSPFRPMRPDEREVMQTIVNEYYARFVGVVNAHHQFATPEIRETTTDGRVFSGAQAVALGLADKSGTLDDAIALAKEVTKAPNAKVVMYKRPYGYSGSIYASAPIDPPRANVTTLNLPGVTDTLPTGFYYLWEPGK